MAFFHGPLSRTLAAMSLDDSALSDLDSEFYDTYVIHPESHDHQLYTCDIFAMRPGKTENPVLGSVSLLFYFLLFVNILNLYEIRPSDQNTGDTVTSALLVSILTIGG